MTSKEAFEKMVELCNHYHHTIVKDTDIQTIYGYPVDNIRKDLEMLEILKKYLVVETMDNEISSWERVNCYLTKGKIKSLENKEDFEKIKEWLNGNN